jgi:hypothetical protein
MGILPFDVIVDPLCAIIENQGSCISSTAAFQKEIDRSSLRWRGYHFAAAFPYAEVGGAPLPI